MLYSPTDLSSHYCCNTFSISHLKNRSCVSMFLWYLWKLLLCTVLTSVEYPRTVVLQDLSLPKVSIKFLKVKLWMRFYQLLFSHAVVSLLQSWYRQQLASAQDPHLVMEEMITVREQVVSKSWIKLGICIICNM